MTSNGKPNPAISSARKGSKSISASPSLATPLPLGGQAQPQPATVPLPQDLEARLTQAIEELLQANPKQNVNSVAFLVLTIHYLFPTFCQDILDYRKAAWRPDLGGLRDMRIEGMDLYLSLGLLLRAGGLGRPLAIDKETCRWLRQQRLGPPSSFTTVFREGKRIKRDLLEGMKTETTKRTPEQEKLLALYPSAALYLSHINT